jgi:hypothetical protein
MCYSPGYLSRSIQVGTRWLHRASPENGTRRSATPRGLTKSGLTKMGTCCFDNRLYDIGTG